MKRVAIILALLFILSLVPPTAALHAAPSFDRIIKAGESVDEDLTVFGGELVIEEGATVNGDVSVFGGTATLAGRVDGNISLFGGKAKLTGTVDGDLVVLGGDLEAATTANIDGDCVLVSGTLSGDGSSGLNCTRVADLPDIAIPAFVRPSLVPSLPQLPRTPRATTGSQLFGTLSATAGRSILLGMLALVIAVAAPAQLNQVGDTLRRKPAASGVVGLLTAVAGPSLAVLLLIVSVVLTIVCIGLLGYPVVLVLSAALVAGLVLGWVAAGTLMGERLAVWLKLSNRSLPVTATLGTVVLTVAAGLLSSLPIWLGGWLWAILGLAIGCAGLGAVALTRFGTRSYPLAGAMGSKVTSILEALPEEEDEKV